MNDGKTTGDNVQYFIPQTNWLTLPRDSWIPDDCKTLLEQNPSCAAANNLNKNECQCGRIYSRIPKFGWCNDETKNIKSECIGMYNHDNILCEDNK